MKKYLINDFDFTKYAEAADELPLWSAPFGLKLLDYINYKAGITVLDIGFGTGFPLTEIASRLGGSSVVYGIDPWKEAIKRANKKIDYFGLKNVRIIEGTAESLPISDGTIDLITSNNCINNVSDAEKALSECSRVLKQGGQFVHTMNTDLSMIELYTQLSQVLSELNMNKEIDLMHKHISLKRPPIDRVISMIQKNGLVIKDLVHDQFNYKFADGTALLNHYFIRLAFMDSWIKLLPPDKIEQIFNEIELRLNENSRLFGCVKLSIPFVLINAIKQ